MTKAKKSRPDIEATLKLVREADEYHAAQKAKAEQIAADDPGLVVPDDDLRAFNLRPFQPNAQAFARIRQHTSHFSKGTSLPAPLTDEEWQRLRGLVSSRGNTVMTPREFFSLSLVVGETLGYTNGLVAEATLRARFIRLSLKGIVQEAVERVRDIVTPERLAEFQRMSDFADVQRVRYARLHVRAARELEVGDAGAE